MNQKQVRKFYKEINRTRKDFKPRLALCKGKEGQIISEKDKILGRWQEYFQSLLTGPEAELTTDDTMKILNYDEVLEPLLTMEESENAIAALKNNKSPGIDNLQAELIKYGSNELAKNYMILSSKYG
jgi:hypothetical protein